MNHDAKVHVRNGRTSAALAVALAFCCAPAAFGQGAGTTAGSSGEAGPSNPPVCGSPAGSGTPTTKVARPAARSASAAASAAPVLGTLTLDQEDQETVTSAAFGRSTGPQSLTLVYRVHGCRVTPSLPRPVSPLPTGPVRTGGMRTLPRGAVQIDDVDADGDRYVVHLRIRVASDGSARRDAAGRPTRVFGVALASSSTSSGNGRVRSAATAPAFTLAPGSYTGFVRLEAPWMHTVATPVTVTRSESDLLVPIVIGLLGSGVGFLLFWLARTIHHDDLLVKEEWVLWFTGVVSVVFGAGSAFFTNYVNQDVWTWSANGLALFTAAFSASTAGVAAGLLTGIYKTSAPAPPPVPREAH
jgi:hypothetical protein